MREIFSRLNTGLSHLSRTITAALLAVLLAIIIWVPQLAAQSNCNDTDSYLATGFIHEAGDTVRVIVMNTSTNCTVTLGYAVYKVVSPDQSTWWLIDGLYLYPYVLPPGATLDSVRHVATVDPNNSWSAPACRYAVRIFRITGPGQSVIDYRYVPPGTDYGTRLIDSYESPFLAYCPSPCCTGCTSTPTPTPTPVCTATPTPTATPTCTPTPQPTNTPTPTPTVTPTPEVTPTPTIVPTPPPRPPVEIAQAQLALDSSALSKKKYINRSTRVYRNSLKMTSKTRRFAAQVDAEAQSLYQQSWTTVYSLPPVVCSCGISLGCTGVSTAPLVDAYRTNNDKFSSLMNAVIKQMRRAPRAAIRKVRGYSTRLNALTVQDQAQLSQIPALIDVCPNN